MKLFVTLLLSSLLFTGCFTKGNLAKVTVSPNYQKGVPMRVLVLPFAVDGNPDMLINDSYTELLSGTLMQCGLTPIDAHSAAMNAGMSGADFRNIYTADNMAKVVAASKADIIMQGSVTYDFAPPTSGTTPESMQKDRNDSTHHTTTTYTGATSYATGGYFAEKSMSLRISDAHSGMVLVSEYLDNAAINGYFNSSATYRPIDELSEALKKNLK
jgi:hypothetical protein